LRVFLDLLPGWAQKSQKTQKEFLAQHDELLKFQEFYKTKRYLKTGTFHFVRFLKFEVQDVLSWRYVKLHK
jgi:hypothetical protein